MKGNEKAKNFLALRLLLTPKALKGLPKEREKKKSDLI